MIQNYSKVGPSYSRCYKLLLLPLFCFMLLSEVRAQDVFTVGPTLHFNFGDKRPRVSWGVEASLWWYKDAFPVSGSFGFDHRKGSSVLYLQGQTGVALAGISAGPYLQLKKGEAPALGLQTDYWVNYYMGLNYRVRYGKGENQKAIGFYVKAPIELGANSEEDNNDWDWD